MARAQVLYSLAAFLFWTLTSFLCHKLAKLALTSFSQNVTSRSPVLGAVLVTLCQVTTCYSVMQFPSQRRRLFLVMAVSHSVATLSTNTSLALLYASSTMVVKLLEPMTSAVVQRLILKQPMRVEAVISMAAIVSGAVLYVGDPRGSRVSVTGIAMALLSNVVLGLRNVAVKLDQAGGSRADTAIRPCPHIAAFLAAALLLLGVTTVSEMTFPGAVPSGSAHCLLLALGSSLCHVMYSYVSTYVVLHVLSVVSHAIANIAKRVSVVLMLQLTGLRLVSLSNWAGLALCTCGLLVYSGRKISQSVSDSRGLACPAGVAAKHAGGQDGKPANDGEFSQKTRLLSQLLALCLCSYLFVFLHIIKENRNVDYAHLLRHGKFSWRDGLPLLNQPITFQPPHKNEASVAKFLELRPLDVPSDTDQLSPYLTTATEVLREAERIHIALLTDLLGGKKHAVLIGAASFENKGDPAITIGQLKLLEKLGVKLVFYINEENCDDRHYQRAVNATKGISEESLVILMQGGGNLIGYPGVNYCRGMAFSYFPHNQVVLLSQSVMMQGPRAVVDEMVSLYCCRPRLTILLRDRLSFHIASRMFANGTRLVLAPDMAFGVGPVARFSPPFYDVLWLRRGDKERLEYGQVPRLPPNVSLHVADWWHADWDTPHGDTTVETAHHVLLNGLLFLQRGRVVVTERLHGHVLATLLDMPHVLLDNGDRKLSSYHNTWTRGLANVRLASTPRQAALKAVELLRVHRTSLPPIFQGMDIDEHG